MVNMRKQSAVEYIKATHQKKLSRKAHQNNSDSMFTQAINRNSIYSMQENFYQNPFTHQYFYVE
jgi:hypothetical protein